jgi:mRNA-degrading endonuclease RelE of RelBE toxin-antitoxin system
MSHRASRRFWRHFDRLPKRTQANARRTFDLLKTNPSHPALRFKKVGTLWSARVGRAYRALAVEDDDGLIWVWIGRHDEYEQLIGR